MQFLFLSDFVFILGIYFKLSKLIFIPLYICSRSMFFFFLFFYLYFSSFFFFIVILYFFFFTKSFFKIFHNLFGGFDSYKRVPIVNITFLYFLHFSLFPSLFLSLHFILSVPLFLFSIHLFLFPDFHCSFFEIFYSLNCFILIFLLIHSHFSFLQGFILLLVFL